MLGKNNPASDLSRSKNKLASDLSRSKNKVASDLSKSKSKMASGYVKPHIHYKRKEPSADLGIARFFLSAK